MLRSLISPGKPGAGNRLMVDLPLAYKNPSRPSLRLDTNAPKTLLISTKTTYVEQPPWGRFEYDAEAPATLAQVHTGGLAQVTEIVAPV
jgi:hypothetical protein